LPGPNTVEHSHTHIYKGTLAVDHVDLPIPRGTSFPPRAEWLRKNDHVPKSHGGVDRPTTGSIAVDGTNIVRLSETRLVAYRLERVGFVFQFFNLVPRLTAWENVELPVRFAGLGAKEREQRTTDLLPAVGVSEEGECPGD